MDTNAVSSLRTMNIVAGVLGILLGLGLVAWPGISALWIAVFLGAQLIVSGIVLIASRIANRDDGSVALAVVGGSLAIMIGIATFRFPGRTIAIIAIFIGAGWLVSGLAEFFAGFRGPGTRWGGVAAGLLSALAGLVMMGSPISSAAALVWIGGIAMIAMGLVRVIKAREIAEAIAGITIDIRAAEAVIDEVLQP